MTIDNFADAVAEAHARGYRINNCFERNVPGHWQANLRAEGEKVFSEYGTATTPHGAIMAALKVAPVLRHEVIVEAAQQAERLSLFD